MKLARAEREINDVGDCRNKNRSTGFEKPGGNRIKNTMFIRTVEKNLGDFHVRESAHHVPAKLSVTPLKAKNRTPSVSTRRYRL